MKNSTQSPQRLEYIDLAKGIGIILVVIGHSINGHGITGHYISSFHMPLFFLLSGLCFNDSRYPNFTPFLKKGFGHYCYHAYILLVLCLCYQHCSCPITIL